MMRAGKSAGGTRVQWAERVRAYVRMHGAGYTLHRAGEMLAARVLLRDEWRFRREKASKRELAAQRAHPFPDVCISVVVPVFNTRPKFLRALADSLLAQTHGAWEACLYDGGSTSAETRKALEAIAARDSRFHIAFGAENAGISGNTNRAIKMATGEYIALCDHDDVLAPDALWRIAEAIDAHHPDVLYTDEDKLTAHGAIHVDAHRKPDFCPDNLRSGNYICHLSVIRRTLLDAIGGLRPTFDGSQDHDLLLRACERADGVIHIPRVLYHWRTLRGSMSHTKLAVCLDAAARAVEESMRRNGFPGTCRVEDGVLRLRYDVGDFTVAALRLARDASAADVNRLAADSSVDMLLFLWGDTAEPDADGLREMMMYAQRPDVCAVMPLVADARNRVLHAGYDILPDGTVRSRNRGLPVSAGGWHGMNRTSYNVTAVSPMCFLVRRNAFVPLAEGESLAVDLAQWCMARMQEGMRHVYTPHCVVKADAESAFEGFRVQVPAGWYDPCATGSKRA